MINRVRLVSGLILFAYVLHHLATHALGLVSLAAMEDGGRLFIALWRSPAATVLLYGALAVHFALALYALYRCGSLRLRAAEAAQLALGLAVVPLLAEHALGTRWLAERAGVDAGYTYVILVLWHFVPAKGAVQAAALVVAWGHAMIGLCCWLRLKPWFARWATALAVVAVLVPVLALLGFVAAGRELDVMARDPQWLRATMRALHWPGGEAVAQAGDIKLALWWAEGILVAGALALRAARRLTARWRDLVRVVYPGRTVAVPAGSSVLDASRLGHIPHAAICGGRGRCSTCRVRITAVSAPLAPPDAAEAMVLARVGAPDGVRLACRLRPPAGEIHVVPLLSPNATMRDVHEASPDAAGTEREIVILFADVRDFTKMVDGQLPYDVVFLLNRYFAAMGGAVEAAGGCLDKFIGDGVMALFGLGSDATQGCHDALRAARAMAQALGPLNESLADDISEPIRIGIGIHAGAVITGEMGYGRARQFTAIGDAVNVASRLQSMTKEQGCQLVLSAIVAECAGLDVSGLACAEVEVRGLAQPVGVVLVPDAAALPV